MRRTSRGTWALAIGAVLAQGCSDDPAPATDAGAVTDGGNTVADAGAPTFSARFVLPAEGLPQPGQVPFPTDLYRTDPDGTLSDRLEVWSALGVRNTELSFAEGYGALDGFGRIAGALFVMEGTGEVMPRILPPVAADAGPDVPYAIVNVDPMSPTVGQRVPAAAGFVPGLRVLSVQPDGVVLAPGRRYAFVLTTRLQSSAGALAPTAAFVAVRDAAMSARTTPAARLYADAANRVVAAGIARDRIAAMSVFTTQTTAGALRRVRDGLVAGRYGAAPQLNTDAMAARPYTVARFGAAMHDGWTATLDAWMGTPRRDAMMRDLPGEPGGGDEATVGYPHDAIGAVVTGTFVSPEFRRARAGQPLRDDGTIAFDAMGEAVAVNAMKTLPVTLVLPRALAPSTGYPVVIFGHGLGGQRKQLFGVANELARAGIATVGIDTATFGQRAGAMFEADTSSLFAGRGTYMGPDGLPDAEGYDNTNFFGSLTAPMVVRDNIRQTALDYVQLRRLVANPMLNLGAVAAQYGGTAPRLDPARVGYIGNSLGGIIGTVFAAIEPDVNPFVLNVPGAGLVSALGADSPSIGPNLVAAASLFFRFPTSVPVDRWHPLVTLFQGPLDGGDPGCYAADAARQHDIFMGIVDRDSVVPNRANALLARALGLSQVRGAWRVVGAMPEVDNPVRGNAMGRTHAAVLQYPATHGSNLSFRFGTQTYVPAFPRDDMAARFPMVMRPARVRQPLVAYQRSIVGFLTTGWQGPGMATVDAAGIDAFEDFDDDGWTDTEEAMRSTDPYDASSRPMGMAPRTRDVGF